MLFFEDHQALLLHRQLGNPQNATSVDELLTAKCATLPPRSERESLLASWLPPSLIDDVPAILDTLQVLREALILSSVHVDHCFSVIAETPKNKLLRLLLHRYLESPLSNDFTQSFWNRIEEIKGVRTFTFIDGSTDVADVIGVPAVQPSLLFVEFINALRLCPGFTSVGMVNPFTPPPFFYAQPEETLVTLAEKVAVEFQNGEQVVIAFAGTPQSRLLFTSLLARLSVPVHDNLAALPSGTPNKVARLRREKRIPLKRRLEISEQWIHGITTGTAVLSPEEETFLESSNTEPISPAANGGVIMTGLLPTFSGEVQHFGFADVSLFRADQTSTIFLSSQEREQLFMGGFPVPRAHDQIQQQINALAQLGPASTIYWAADTDKCPFPLLPLSATPPDSQTKRHLPHAVSYQANVSVKAFSATALEAFEDCPAKYFLTNRLRLRTKHATEKDSGLFFGQAVHLALERYLTAGNTLPLNTLFTTALGEAAPNLTPDSTIYAILHHQFNKVSKRFSRLEKQITEMFPESTPWKLEADFFTELEGVAITGKIDRMQKLRDGSLLILDYKTGTVDFSPDHMTTGKNFQALLYLIGTEAISPSQPLAGILFYDLKETELRRGLLRESLCGTDVKKLVTRGHTVSDERWETLLTAGKAKIKETVSRVKAGDFSPQPDAGTCRYCEGSSLCRRADGFA